jgi:general L-amino acid transport system permease protein
MGHFNVVGGVEILPELAALLLALSIYTAAFIAEVVRAGVLAVAPGQAEAAKSLGLRSGATLRLVVVPQAMRVIIPPLTSQYLNLIKNSSLAVAIGYPDLVQVFAGSVLNLTGQAVEVIAITMAVYLIISLATSLLMNLYGYAIAVEER